MPKMGVLQRGDMGLQLQIMFTTRMGCKCDLMVMIFGPRHAVGTQI